MTLEEKNNYQKLYRKYKVHRLIIFSQEQYQYLKAKAKKAGKPFGTMIRELALAQATNQYVLPFDEQTHQVKILLIRYGTNLNQIAHLVNSTKKISPEIIQKIQTEFVEMQAGIMKIYNAPIQVKDLVRHTLIKSPDYVREIKQVLNEFQK